MRSQLLLAAVLLCIVWMGCSKDKFTTKPQIVFKGVNGNVFRADNLIDFQFEATDKEGDLQDTLYVQRVTTVCPDLNVVTPFEMPATVKKSDLKVQVDVVFVYRNPNPPYVLLGGCSERDDTATFKFWVKDVAGHVSDTIQSPPIVLLKN